MKVATYLASFIFFFAVLLAVPAQAQEVSEPVVEASTPSLASSTNSASAPGSVEYLLKVTFGLSVVIALIFAIAWVFKRFGQLPLGGGEQFKVVASLVVGQRERLMVVEIGGEQVLIGVAPGQLVKLHDIKNPIEVLPRAAAGTVFAEKLKQALKGRERP